MSERNYPYMLGQLEYVSAELVRAIEGGATGPNLEAVVQRVREVLVAVGSAALVEQAEASR